MGRLLRGIEETNDIAADIAARLTPKANGATVVALSGIWVREKPLLRRLSRAHLE